MQQDEKSEAPLDAKTKLAFRTTRYGLVGLLVLGLLLFFYVAQARQGEDIAKMNAQIQANEVINSDICKVYPKQQACLVSKEIADNPGEVILPKDGQDGEKGPKGDKGNDGRGITTFDINKSGDLIVQYTDKTSQNAGHVVGKPGENGKNGQAGKNGEAGTDGTNGVNGINGADGRGILSTAITDGSLVIRYTDGTTENLGIVVGPKGDPGTNGTNGADGISVTNVSVTTDGTVSVSYSDGRTEVAGKIIVNTITKMVCENDTLTITVTDGSFFSATVDCTPEAIPGLSQ